MGDTYDRLRKGEAYPVLMVCYTVFALPSHPGDKSNIFLYSPKKPFKSLDLDGANLRDTTWAKSAQDGSERSEEVSATGQTV